MNDPYITSKNKQQKIKDVELEIIDKLNQIHALMAILDPTAASIIIDIDHKHHLEDGQYTISVASCGNEIKLSSNDSISKVHFKVEYRRQEPSYLTNYTDIQGEIIEPIRVN